TLNRPDAPLSLLITFPQVINMVAGAQYAIVVNYQGAPPPGAGQFQGTWAGAVGDPYPAGALCSSAFDGIWWECATAGDLHFQTYVHPAQAGFNVNSLVSFTPLSSTYRTLRDTTGCPAGFSGKFTFTALLTNKIEGAAMPGVTVH